MTPLLSYFQVVMSQTRNIIFCGGGSGGHVIPALTLIRKIREKDSDLRIVAIGSLKGIEASLFPENNVEYQAIQTGKLRRYLSIENLTDIFRLLIGVIQSFIFLLKFNKSETVVFSTGGFVTVPVVFAAFLQGKKVLIHEQTSRVGLANKIASKFASKVLISFEASSTYFPQDKTIHTGYPLREEILVPPLLKNLRPEWNAEGRPILFLTGGGNGSLLLNNTLESCLNELAEKFFIVHQCGASFIEKYQAIKIPNYVPLDFVGKEMTSLLNEAEVVISRAGAGTVVELMSLGKPSILIPLKIAQKNEQFHNAEEAVKQCGSIIIEEDSLTKDVLLESIDKIQNTKRVEKVELNPTEEIVGLIFNR